MNRKSNLETIKTNIRRELGRRFSLTLLRAHVAYLRNKPLRVEESRLRTGVTGACFSLEDCDIVIVRNGLTTERRLMTHLHEYAHIVLGHAPHLPFTYAQLTTQLDLKDMLCRSVYDDPRDREAETLASLLRPYLVDEDDLPEMARALYGDM